MIKITKAQLIGWKPCDIDKRLTMFESRESLTVRQAIKVFRFVKRCKDSGTTWKRNGDTLPVGAFQVDHINADGSFRAGCHLILWPEIERTAALAGEL